MLYFDINEYKGRIRKTKKRMETEGIDVLFISQPANMNYLTGYDGWSFYVHQGVIVSLDKEGPIWVGRAMDANGAKITTFLKDEDIRGYADDYVQSKAKHPMQFVADIIKKKKWENKTIAVEMDQFYFTHRGYLELEKALPKAKFKDGNLLVNIVRMIKSEKEIKFMKKAGEIAVKVMQAGIDSVNIGVRECDAAANISYAQIKGTKEYGGDYPAIVPLMMAGEGTSTPHLTWSDRKFKNNEAIILELSGVYKHYHAPIARTIYLGNPPKIMKDTADVVINGLAKTLEFIKPGVTCEEVEAKWRDAISHSTVVKESRLGYSIGLNYPPDWGEQTISLRPGDKTILQSNMTFHLIPGIWYKEVGFEVDASIRITENGYESLYNFPMELFIK
ncbi:ectoine hydrolase DoeA [Candidatus Atribacteria bacterium HGW-Atribacteria-1]|nr:MAG: ectoine hydrolase DoeA [Candidatus Atribacteria bacterium HGW-Atribacteria-1]